jgi:hypothetical protein
MGLNLSNRQIAAELGMGRTDIHKMTDQLRSGVESRKPETELSGEVECDEVYVIAGHKGKPGQVKKRPEGPEKPFEGSAWQGNPGKGKASGIRYDPAIRRGGDQDAGKRQTGNHKAADHEDDPDRILHIYG